MNKIEKYIIDTRGCSLPIDEGTSKCNNCITDTMHAFNWGENIKPDILKKNLVEARFKNNRKDIYENQEELFLKKGDIVAVEAPTGHDIGIINLTGETAQRRAFVLDSNTEIPKVYRKARQVDIEKWEEALNKEEIIFNRTKEIIVDLNLEMKLGDVEFQGDGTKATFFYTAEDRVDFRELIKLLAQEFKLRIEMRQIGARQESARIGGLGTCGMELCCIRWKRNFESVTTNSARYQELSLNPSKLAGQCGKLKCCLNYEVDSYIEARDAFPDTSITLKTKGGNAYFQKSDVFKQILWYSFDPENSVNITSLTIERVNEIIIMNEKGIIPDTLLQDKLELSDLIKSKHNVSISSEEIIDSKNSPQIIEDKKKRPNKKHKKNFNNKNNSNPNNLNPNQNNLNPNQNNLKPNQNNLKPNPNQKNQNQNNLKPNQKNPNQKNQNQNNLKPNQKNPNHNNPNQKNQNPNQNNPNNLNQKNPNHNNPNQNHNNQNNPKNKLNNNPNNKSKND